MQTYTHMYLGGYNFFFVLFS